MQDDELMKALANYTGPVTRCRPGRARGKRVKPVPVREGPASTMARRVDVGHERRALKHDETAKWLSEHAEAIANQERWVEREKERRNRERHLRQRQARARQARVFNAAQACYSTMGAAFSARGNIYTPLKLEMTA